jgi:hypothetical protein
MSAAGPLNFDMRDAPRDREVLLYFHPFKNRRVEKANGRVVYLSSEARFRVGRWYDAPEEPDIAERKHALVMRHGGFWASSGSGGIRPFGFSPDAWAELVYPRVRKAAPFETGAAFSAETL